MNKEPVCRHVQASNPPDDWVRSTTLFSYWQAMKAEILRHKWYESEKAGYDIGWDRASANWRIHHQRGFQLSMQNREY